MPKNGQRLWQHTWIWRRAKGVLGNHSTLALCGILADSCCFQEPLRKCSSQAHSRLSFMWHDYKQMCLWVTSFLFPPLGIFTVTDHSQAIAKLLASYWSCVLIMIIMFETTWKILLVSTKHKDPSQPVSTADTTCLGRISPGLSLCAHSCFPAVKLLFLLYKLLLLFADILFPACCPNCCFYSSHLIKSLHPN